MLAQHKGRKAMVMLTIWVAGYSRLRRWAVCYNNASNRRPRHRDSFIGRRFMPDQFTSLNGRWAVGRAHRVSSSFGPCFLYKLILRYCGRKALAFDYFWWCMLHMSLGDCGALLRRAANRAICRSFRYYLFHFHTAHTHRQYEIISRASHIASQILLIWFIMANVISLMSYILLGVLA